MGGDGLIGNHLEGTTEETASRDRKAGRDRQGRPRPNRVVGCDAVCDWEAKWET